MGPRESAPTSRGVLLLDGAPLFHFDKKGIGRITCVSDGVEFRFACTPHEMLVTKDRATVACAKWSAENLVARPIKKKR